jgi:hypothetical protein
MSFLKKISKKIALFKNSYYIIKCCPRGQEKAMEKLIKIFVIAGLSMAFIYAQSVDTTVKKDSLAQAVKAAGTVATSSGEKKAVTANKPKPPTNWSKVKDLFL